jgi:sugar phosphate isomerase/epimerase
MGVVEALTYLVEQEGVENIELSAGLYDPTGIQWLRDHSHDLSVQLHNYFPVPRDPFVLNLSSINSEIRDRSVALALDAIELSHAIGATRYSVHAGFCADPNPKQLGRRWDGLDRFGAEAALECFGRSLDILAHAAHERGITLLVENNVLISSVAADLGEDVLLMASVDQILSTMEMLPQGVRLLLDVGHLGVSCQTLGVDPRTEIQRLEGWIGGYHLSENNGSEDENRAVNRESWFWTSLRNDVDFVTLEVKASAGEVRNQVTLTQQLWGCHNGIQ